MTTKSTGLSMIETLQDPVAQSEAKGPRAAETPSVVEEPLRNGPSTAAPACADELRDTKRPSLRAHRGAWGGVEPGRLSERTDD